MSYSNYGLSDNPFPESAFVKFDSEDIRVNGTIFREAVFEKEIAELRERIHARTNMVYLAGLQVEKGVGKSALLVHELRILDKAPEIPTAYVRCTNSPPNNRPAGFCGSIVTGLHKRGWLWKAFQRHLLEYCKQRQSVTLEQSALQTMFRTLKWPVESVPLTLYTHITDSSRLAQDFAGWLTEKCRTGGETPLLFSSNFLKTPSKFPSDFNKTRHEDKVDMYESVLRILTSSGFGPCYFFLDQWEDAIVSTPGSRIGEFSAGMRRLVEASMNMATIIVTLHPDSERKLDTPAAQHLLAVAPLDTRHLVDLSVLDKRSEEAVLLATEYMEYFRTRKGDPPTYPLDPKVIRYICFVKEGNIRNILQQLHQCIRCGAMQNHSYVDMEFVRAHHNETMGAEINDKKYKEFAEEA